MAVKKARTHKVTLEFDDAEAAHGFFAYWLDGGGTAAAIWIGTRPSGISGIPTCGSPAPATRSNGKTVKGS